MRGRIGRTLSAAVVAAVLLTSSPTAPAVVQAAESERESPCENCADLPTDKAYDEPAVLIRVTWKPQKDVRLNYWAAPPGSDPYTGAYWSGGCVDPSRPSQPAQPLVLTEAWVGGKNLWYEPGSFELIAEAHACVFADDIDKKDPSREGPRHRAVCATTPSVRVTATVEHYRAGESAPHAVEPPVGPMSAPVTLYPCETKPGKPAPDPDRYRRTLGTFKWDPATGISNPQVAEAPTAETADLPPPTSYEETPTEETAEERRWRATVMLAVLVFGGPRLFLAAALTGDWERALEILKLGGDAEDSPEAVGHPTKSPPEMSDKASKQGRQWVWLPTEASVRKKGATHWLKPGAWYQTKVDKDGDRTFYDKKGKLIGRTRDKVQVKVWGKEAEVPDQDAAGVMRTMLIEATTGQVHLQPASPPPTARPEHGHYWVYVPLPTRTFHQDRAGLTGYNYWREAHVLMPGRWYQGTYRASKGRWWIYTTDGQFLGAEPDKDFVKVSPTTPLPEDESR